MKKAEGEYYFFLHLLCAGLKSYAVFCCSCFVSRYSVDVQKRVRLAGMRSAMQRVRYSMYPPAPQTLEGLTAILQNPRYRVISATSCANDNLHAASVTAEDGSHNAIFMSRRMARIARSLSILLGDGTFKTQHAIAELDDASQVIIIFEPYKLKIS